MGGYPSQEFASMCPHMVEGFIAQVNMEIVGKLSCI